MDVQKNDGNSESDWPIKLRPESTRPPAVPGQHPDDEFYKMSHENRGVALLFNQRCFDSHLRFKERKGTELDINAMESVLKKLKFEINVYNDLNRDDILRELEAISKMDHSQNDCLVIAVMSHGRSYGRIYARNAAYTIYELLDFFSGKNCPTLAGKPKLFFIEACRGVGTDSGVEIKVESDTLDANEKIVYTIPVMADILIMYATVEGYYAYKDATGGSYFIQALAKNLEEYYDSRDLLSILTKVNRDVAIGFQSNTLEKHLNGKKEMCSIVSMLIRFLYFG